MRIAQAQKRAAAQLLQSYEGTKHAPRRARPGKGVDCIQLVVATLQAAEILPEFEWPQYRQDVGLYLKQNSLTPVMLKAFYAEERPLTDEPQDFDVGIFKVGRLSNHCGIMMNGRFWHVAADFPVHHTAPAAIAPQLETVVRFTKRGIRTEPKTLNK